MTEMARSFATYGASPVALEDRFEVIKDIGDGSFGSVVLARVRTAGAHVARRGTIVSCAISHSPSLLPLRLAQA